jgi:hypothetical protein
MNVKTFSIIAALISLAVGLIVSNAIIAGVAKALFGVGFIMFYIFLVFRKMPSEKH